MKKTIDSNITSLLSSEYVPLAQVVDYLKSNSNLGYKTTFSFTPFMETFSQKLTKGCDCTKSAMYPVMEQYREFIEGVDDIDSIKEMDAFKAILSLVVPNMMFESNYSFIAKPFDKEFVMSSDRMDQLFFDGEYEMKIVPELMLDTGKTRRMLHLFILHKLYGIDLMDTTMNMLTFRNKTTEIEQHFQMDFQMDFIDIKTSETVPELSNADINYLLDNLDNNKVWLEYFPKDSLEFYGFVIGSLVNVTDVETENQMKQFLSAVNREMNVKTFLPSLTRFFKSYLNVPDLEIGELIFDNRNVLRSETLSLLRKSGTDFKRKYFNSDKMSGIYQRVFEEKAAVYTSNLITLPSTSKLEQKLIDANYKSIVLCPLLDKDGEVNVILEIGSKQPYVFNKMNVSKMDVLFNILDDSYNQVIDGLNDKISTVIKEKFTAIHPAVEWKFEESATDYLNAKLSGAEEDLAPVVFDDLYPLYGQADIVSSSKIRNAAIKNDLIENLQKVKFVLASFLKKKELHLLKSFEKRVDMLISDLELDFKSSDETNIVTLLQDEIHPLLNELIDRHKELPKKVYNDYINALDDRFGIVYNERKSFEESVTKITMGVANFLLNENEKLQTVLPHYFEKYKTDGVEYNIYLGQSLLKDATYNDYDLKEFKVWQLVNMAKVTRLVADMQTSLPMPLTTAQLIFVYNNAISIRFRMDEKRFDVDGAYNVRYEILKKRIDKAYVKGTEERLTQAGKIAIVYLQESDRQEYLEYLTYLEESGYITNDIEDLELDRMQGVDGLRALRVTVKP